MVSGSKDFVGTNYELGVDMSLGQEDVYLSCGSNEGKPIDNCQLAVQMLVGHRHIDLGVLSSLYLTEPVSEIDQRWIFNFCVKVRTDLEPDHFLSICQGIEQKLGRTRHEVWGPRTMDIDIIYFGKRVIDTESLIVPHPFRFERKFVLIPLAEISPEIIDPIRNRSVLKLVRLTHDRHAVLLYERNWFAPKNGRVL